MTNKSNNPKDADNESFGTGWGNEPTIMDLKQDFQSSQSNHKGQVAKIDQWLDNLFVKSDEGRDTGNPFGTMRKTKVRKGKSTIQNQAKRSKNGDNP